MLVLVITPGARTPSLRLIVAAIGLVIVADTAATALGLLEIGSTGPIDFIWLASYVLVGAAGLHPSMRPVGHRTRRPVVFGRAARSPPPPPSWSRRAPSPSSTCWAAG